MFGRINTDVVSRRSRRFSRKSEAQNISVKWTEQLTLKLTVYCIGFQSKKTIPTLIKDTGFSLGLQIGIRFRKICKQPAETQEVTPRRTRRPVFSCFVGMHRRLLPARPENKHRKDRNCFLERSPAPPDGSLKIYPKFHVRPIFARADRPRTGYISGDAGCIGV